MIFYLRLPLFSLQSDFVADSNPKPHFKIFHKYIMCCQQTIVTVMSISCILFHVFFEGKTWPPPCFPCTTRASTYNRRVWSHKVSSEARSPGERVHPPNGEKEDHRLKKYQTEVYGYLTSQILQCGDVIFSEFQDSKSESYWHLYDAVMMQLQLKTNYETL